MANVLEKIVADKREEVAARKDALRLESFKADLVPSEKAYLLRLASPTPALSLNVRKHHHRKGLFEKSSI